MWFHRPFRADEWLLYDQVSPSASGARGLALGRLFTEDGRLVATVAQEGLIRPVVTGRRRNYAAGITTPPLRGVTDTPTHSYGCGVLGCHVVAVTSCGLAPPTHLEATCGTTSALRPPLLPGVGAGSPPASAGRAGRPVVRREQRRGTGLRDALPVRAGWYGSTRANHSPSSLSIDWNRTDDYGDMVVSRGAGRGHPGDGPGRPQLRPLRHRRPRQRRDHAVRAPERVLVDRRAGRRPGHADRAGRRAPAAAPVRTCTSRSGRTGSTSTPTSTARRSGWAARSPRATAATCR